MLEISRKKAKETAITHGGVFHADDVFATVVLRKVFGDINVSRVFSVPENLSDDVIVFDIGFGKYDHHQKDKALREDGVPYAAVGLLWRDFGPQICADTPDPDFVWEQVDKMLIKGIDAIDNGAMLKTDYPAQAMNICQMISLFNPTWDSEQNSDVAFWQAVDFAEAIFDKLFASVVSTAKAQNLVEQAIEESDGNIMVLDRFVPWQEAIFASENPKADGILYVVFPSNRGGFNWQCVPDAPGSFGQRKSVPESWKGLRDEVLQAETGVETAIFCHPAGFMGAAETLEDCLKMAQMAVEA